MFTFLLLLIWLFNTLFLTWSFIRVSVYILNLSYNYFLRAGKNVRDDNIAEGVVNAVVTILLIPEKTWAFLIRFKGQDSLKCLKTLTRETKTKILPRGLELGHFVLKNIHELR